MKTFDPILPGSIPTIRPKTVRKADEESRRDDTFDRSAYNKPQRPLENIIPTPERLQELISKALSALARGVYWERGSIINLLL